MNIKSIIDYPVATSILLFGDSGTGKTTLAATAPGPILFVDVEARLTGIPKDSKIDFVSVYNAQDLRNVYLELAKSEKLKYKTIVIDSLTEVIQLFSNEILQEGGEKRKSPTLTQPEWGLLFQRINSMLRLYRDFPKTKGINLVVTSLAKDKVDEEKVDRIPNIPGTGFPYEVLGLFDAVLYTFSTMRDNKVSFKLLSRDTGKVRAKTPSRTMETIISVDEKEEKRETLGTLIDMILQKEVVKA